MGKLDIVLFTSPETVMSDRISDLQERLDYLYMIALSVAIKATELFVWLAQH